MDSDLNVLVKIDASSYQGVKWRGITPCAGIMTMTGGRVFYIELGHTDASYGEPLYLGLLYGGIQYAMHTEKP